MKPTSLATHNDTIEKISTSIIRREEQLSREQFITHYKNTATPVVLPKAMDKWPAREKWSIDYLAEVAGDIIVPLYNSSPAKDKEHQHAAAVNMPLREYFSLLKKGEKDLRMFFYNILQGAPILIKDFIYPDYGMKFFQRLPVLFAGGRGAKVQMHYDIDLANLFLCHFGGKKKVLLFPPEQTKYMYKVPFSFSSLHDVDYSNPDFEKYPALKKLHGFTAELNHGDTLFIPSGYWHYIVYEEIGFSLTLRSFPTKAKQRLTVLKNIVFTRTVEGFMRKFFGQQWNDRNERLAVEKTHRHLK